MRLNGIRILLTIMAFSLLAPQVQAATPSEFITEAVDLLATKLDGRRSELADDPDHRAEEEEGGGGH